MAYSFGDANAPQRHETQCFEIFRDRGIYHKVWTAVTKHRTAWLTGHNVVMPAFNDDVWELYDTTKDWSQAHDLAKENLELLHQLQQLWLIEAAKHNVLPLDDRFAERGILPEGTELTPINPMAEGTYVEGDAVRPWNSLSDDEKRLFSRMAEVYAGFSEYTDVQVGRLIDYLEESGQLDNTLIFYCADNGASGEGSPNGSVNEYRFFNGYPDDIESNLAMIDRLGSPDTYNHYPTGRAVAFSTPYRMFKRYSQYAGGTCDPLIIHWPKGIKAKGEVRHQYHHCTDIVPTILECCGVSMRYSFDDANAPTTKETQYYEMVGTRGIWHKGWKAATEHGPMPVGLGHFDQDRWQLFHTDEDRAEAQDLADQYPDKVRELAELWLAEAERNNVLPLMDVGIAEIHALEYQAEAPASGPFVAYPGTTEIPEKSSARTLGASFKILAEVEFTGHSQGIIVSEGSRSGGYALFVKNGQLFFVYDFLGIPPEQRLVCPAPTLGKHIVGVEFKKESIGKNHEALGTMTLHVDDKAVASAPFRTQTGHYALAGEGLCIGYDSGDAVSSEYKPQFPFAGGRVVKVVYDVAGDTYENLEVKFAAALARDRSKAECR
jgi:arylsulfatase A-like enzyme